MRRIALPLLLMASLLTASACDDSGSAAPSGTASSSGASAPAKRDRPSPVEEPRPSARPLPPGSPPLPVIPAVRSFTPSSGQGWWPRESGTRVVVERGAERQLGDEARLFAEEIGARTAPEGTTTTRPGDVVLALDPRRSAEGYALDTRGGRLSVSGGSDAGVFYGTRTALQTLRARGFVPSGRAADRPDRPQRGLMVDIARKHFTAKWLEDRVREMGDLKLNQLHLHISDDQGFRVESRSHPEVVSRQHLTRREVRDLVALARSRHISVFPEIDSPGHLGAVLGAHPDLQLRTASGLRVQGAVDISDPRAARIVDDLYREYAGLFPGRWWHLGGDEYLALRSTNPEATYPQLAAYARRRFGPGATVQDAATGWLNDRAATVRALGKTVKAWNDGFATSPRVSAHRAREVEYWTGREDGQRAPAEFLREGRKLVNLNDEYLYYVLGQPNAFRYPTGRRIYEEWSPAVLRGTTPVPAELATPDRVLGGRLAVWCDRSLAQSQDQVARGIRMPLRALAQRVWTPGRPALPWASFTQLATRVEARR